jgi:ADP-ribose pyrophosphatase YjhB (NUDIX family)
MRKLWRLCGRAAYWLTLPALKVYLRPTQRTRVLVVHNQKLLVIKAWLSDGRWSLPGGGLHASELAVAGVKRELQEETGVVLDTAVFQPGDTFQFKNHGLLFSYQLFTVKAAEAYPLSKQRLEITDVAWLPISAVSAQNAAPDVLQALRTWLPER